MSFDLCILATKQRSHPEIVSLYNRLCDGELPDSEPAASLEEFATDLSKAFPELGTLDDDQMDDSPWTSDYDQSNIHIIVCIRWDRHLEVAPVILELAKRHQLLVFDPQDGTVHPPA